ncbi:MAG: cation-translocating P-type ATPase [Lentisphaerae bacterium]|nr:cation-translocating P-type ATPase [Lentisphaerota bacterium]
MQCWPKFSAGSIRSLSSVPAMAVNSGSNSVRKSPRPKLQHPNRLHRLKPREEKNKMSTNINNASSNAVAQDDARKRSLVLVAFAVLGGMLTANSFILSYFLPGQVFAATFSAQFGAFVLAMPIIYTAVKDLFSGKVYMNELVALAILAALAGGNYQTAGGHFQNAGVIAFFLLITIIIESRTASGAQRSIEELVKLTPTQVHLVKDGAEVETDVMNLKLGDIIRVRPGENFPVDALVVSGETIVNQASITGESMPVDKVAGDDVYAGTQNLTGLVELKVTRLGEDTTLGKVKSMIMQAENSRTPIVRIIDRYAGYYTPTILMLAGITWWFTGDISKVITLLVIACPGAIMLASPTAIVAAVAAAARLGIFIKDVSHLELAARIRGFVFDKTGTLTDGLLSVVKLVPFGEVTPAEMLKLAASAEANSNHPTAVALVKLANEAQLELSPVTEFKETHGKGVNAMIDGRAVAVGRSAWLESQELTLPEDFDAEATEGLSVVFVARDREIIGWIGLSDKIRKEAAQALQDLRNLGIRHVAMVTGDRESVAEKVANVLDIDEFRSECLPEAKVEYVENAKKSYPTAVVGDGVNDAPALAEGDLGIAMGAIGSDIAINSASIALMTNDLRRIPMLIDLSQKSRMVIYQNLCIGILFVFGGMVLLVFGKMTPVGAAILYTLSTLVVIFNSARLVRTGEELTLEDNKKKK